MRNELYKGRANPGKIFSWFYREWISKIVVNTTQHLRCSTRGDEPLLITILPNYRIVEYQSKLSYMGAISLCGHRLRSEIKSKCNLATQFWRQYHNSNMDR